MRSTTFLSKVLLLAAFAFAFMLTSSSARAAATFPCTEAGIDNALAAGGASTFTCAASTTIVVTGTKTITVNGTSLDGGGKLVISGGDTQQPVVVNAGVTASISNLVIEHGLSGGYAGNLYVGGTLSLTNSTIRNGQSGFGGAVFVEAGGTLNANGCTIANNVNGPEGSLAVHGTATLVNTTISDGNRGVVVRGGGTANITYSTINVGGEALFAADAGSGATVGHTLLISPAGVPSIDGIGGVGTWVTLGHNMLSKTGLPFTTAGTGDQFDVSPLLGALSDNGGPTFTHALLACSPGINAGATTGGPAVDQRGQTRNQQGAIDIGAYETNSSTCLYVDDVSTAEGNSGTTALTFPVRLSGKSTLAISAPFSFADGTATVVDGDYTALAGILSFGAGATAGSISAQITGDTAFEPNETVTATLGAPTNAVLSDPTGLGTITNDDAAPALSIADVTITEGTGGTTTVDVTVSLDKPPVQTVTVNYATAPGTATAVEDFTAASGVLTFAPTLLTQTITLTITSDAIAEGSESFTVGLSTPTNATIADASGTVTITDDEATPGLSIGGLAIAEGNAGATPASVTVTLSPASATTVTVDWSTVDGTATATDDYTTKSGSLSFAPGETTKNISVDITGDANVETDESFILRLANATGANIATADGTITITNDDVDQPDAGADAGGDDAGTDSDSGTTTGDDAGGDDAGTSIDGGGESNNGGGGGEAGTSPPGSSADPVGLGFDSGLGISPGGGGGGDDCSVAVLGASTSSHDLAFLAGSLALALAFLRRRRHHGRG